MPASINDTGDEYLCGAFPQGPAGFITKEFYGYLQ